MTKASKKDVIYIDVDDDITAIIDRLSSSKSKIVALVLPKRFAVLQSIVNMKLLKRTADDIKKKAVLITSESSLLPLAGKVGIYVSPNLKTRPSVPHAGQTAKIDDSVIEDESAELDLSKTVADHIEETGVEVKEDLKTKTEPKGLSSKLSSAKKHVSRGKSKPDKDIKIPNFGRFRNKILLSLGGLTALLVGWFYAFVIMPTAEINIAAKTTRIPTAISAIVDVSGELASSNEQVVLAGEVREISRTLSETFVATGEKDVGAKASGIISLENCFTQNDLVLPAGTKISDKNSNTPFVTTSAVTVAGGKAGGGGFTCTIPGRADVPVEATTSGGEKNLSPRSYSVANQPELVAFGSQMSGGTTKIVKVVSPADVEEATAKLLEKSDSTVFDELVELFGNDYFILRETFAAIPGEVTTDPAVDSQVDQATVSAQFKYTLVGLSRATVSQALEAFQQTQITDGAESILDNGYDSLVAQLVDNTNPISPSVDFTTDGFSGPEIDTAALAEEISGKRYGDVVSLIKSKPGVRDVEVNFSPAWVFTAPKASKTTINIDLN